MTHYKVEVIQKHIETYVVEADSKEEALIKYEGGDYLDYEHDLDNAQDYEFFSIEEDHEAVLSPTLQKESD